MRKIITVLISFIVFSSQAQNVAPDEDTGPYTTCNPDGANATRDSYDLPNAANVGKIDDRSCYANYKESQIGGVKWGIYNITDGSNNQGVALQPRIERSLPRSKEVGVGSYALFKGTVRILEVGDAARSADDGTYMMQSKGKHSGGGGSPDPAICLYLVKPVLNNQGKQVSFKIYREQINFKGGAGAQGRDIVFLTDIGKNVATDIELKVGFRQDPNDATKTIHYSDAKIGNQEFKWNIPQPERSLESGIRYGAYRVKGGRAQIRWANTTYQKREIPFVPNNNTNRAPEVTLTSPSNNATYMLGEEINLTASASDPDGNLEKVNFKINDAFYRTDNARPFENSFTPTEVGTYKIAAKAFDTDDAEIETFVTISVVAPNVAPSVLITSPANGDVFELGESISLTADALDADGSVVKVNFKVDGTFLSLDSDFPYAKTFTPTEVGTYVIGARAFDNNDAFTEETVTIEVTRITSTSSLKKSNEVSVFPNPSISGVFNLSQSANWEVHDVQGVELSSGEGRKIDLSEENKGLYFLKVNGEAIQVVIP